MDHNELVSIVKGLFDVEELKESIIIEVTQQIIEDCGRDIRRQALQQVETSIAKTINEVAQAAIEKEYQPIDDYGHSAGPITTIRERFKAACINWWNVKVDKNGKPSRSYNDKPRHQWVAAQAMQDIVNGPLRKEFARLIIESKNEVKVGIEKVIADSIARIWK